tara:strand:- start:286 stop:945 length:660 start_codon:yes stop_codon:yes gene_type:complete
MYHLELFSGTHSFGKVSHKLGYSVISLDRDLAGKCPLKSNYDNSANHIMQDIMTWDYKQYPQDYFKLITASPSCFYWSPLRKTNYGKKLKAHNGRVFNEELLNEDINKYGIPMVDKVFEILDYFKPKYWLIENPKLGTMKEYINDLLPYKDIDYCRYGFNYKKPTRIWTNIDFTPLTCTHKKHEVTINEGKGRGGGSNRLPRYVIPPLFIEDLLKNTIF